MVLRYRYLGPEVLAGFDTYKYSCKDTSPLSTYVMHPFWNACVKLCPLWVAPNLLTLVGFLCCVGHWAATAAWDYGFTAGTAPPGVSLNQGVTAGVAVPGYVWVAVAVLLFLSHTLDGIDGKQARRTGSSSPLGELFDHGLDAWATLFISSAIYSVFGRNDDGFSISLFRMFCIHWNVYICFLVSHWEKYNTGVLYLPWGYDVSMVSSFLLYLATAAGGQQMWSRQLPGGIPPGPVFEAATYMGNLGQTVIALWNIWTAHRNGTGHGRSLPEAMRPLAATAAAMALCFAWVLGSRNNVLELDPRCLFLLTGTVFANICCKLIIAQMSSTRCELASFILAPLALATSLALLVPGLSASSELAILYSLALFVLAAHIHYGTCVVMEMCDHFNIRPFHIRPVVSSAAEYQPLGQEDLPVRNGGPKKKTL